VARKGAWIVVHPLVRRVLAAALGAVLSLAFVGPASAAPTGDRADAAAGWLAQQMVNGDHFEATFGDFTFPDQGLTLDAVFAFAATRTADDFGARALTWLAQPDILSGYIGDGVGESYAGSTAKAALAVAVRGGDPTTFGGVDLIARLRARQTPSGRFADRSAFGDFSNVFGQSFAILALARTPAGTPAITASFLISTRCADGGYPVYFDTSPCVGDVDATAIAAQALQAAHRPGEVQSALTYLVGQQQPDGSFVNGGVANANSTGLAGQALLAGARLVAGARAHAFLRSLQVGCVGPVADRGAIAFTTGGLDPTTAVRATAQGALGLAGIGFSRLSSAGSSSGTPTLACP
jgi:hypothetical protein